MTKECKIVCPICFLLLGGWTPFIFFPMFYRFGGHSRCAAVEAHKSWVYPLSHEAGASRCRWVKQRVPGTLKKNTFHSQNSIVLRFQHGYKQIFSISKFFSGTRQNWQNISTSTKSLISWYVKNRYRASSSGGFAWKKPSKRWWISSDPGYHCSCSWGSHHLTNQRPFSSKRAQKDIQSGF